MRVGKSEIVSIQNLYKNIFQNCQIAWAEVVILYGKQIFAKFFFFWRDPGDSNVQN